MLSDPSSPLLSPSSSPSVCAPSLQESNWLHAGKILLNNRRKVNSRLWNSDEKKVTIPALDWWISKPNHQCCRTITFYGSGSELDKLDSGSGSEFWQVTVPIPVPAPVQVPAPYLNHKQHSFQKFFGKNLAFLHGKLIYKEKIDEFFFFKCEWKNVKWRKSNSQFYTVSLRTFVIPFYCGSGTVINYGSGFAKVRN